MQIERKKKKSILLSLLYRLSKFLFFVSPKKRLKLYLELEWIFDRLAHEESFNVFAYENHPIRQHSLNFIKNHVNTNQTILDLGCNSGEITNEIANFCKATIGIDYNENVIKIAKEKYSKSNLEFIHGDAFKYLETKKEQVDVIILSHILEHIDSPIEFLTKCKSFTKYIYIEVPDFDKTYLNHYRTICESNLNYTDDDHVWEFDRQELFEILKNCNLKIIDCEFRFGVIKIWCES